MNGSVKVLSASLPAWELVWARSLGHVIFMVALFAPGHGGWRLFATRRPAAQLTRSVLLMASTLCYFTAVGFIPLADATAVSFTGPIMVAALAGPMLGERVDLRHWLTIACGFVGALVVIRPTGGGANLWALLVLGSAATYGLYQILTRWVSRWDPPETSVSYSALIGAVVLSLCLPLFWRTPARLWHGLLLSALGLLGGLGHYFVARGLSLGPASVVSPFHYVQIVWAAIFGYVVFEHVPGVWTWVGAVIIIGSGLAIAWREAGRARAPGPSWRAPNPGVPVAITPGPRAGEEGR